MRNLHRRMVLAVAAPVWVALAAPGPDSSAQDVPAPAVADPPSAPRDLSVLLEGLPAKHGVPAVGGAIVTAAGAEALGVAGARQAGAEAKVALEDRWHLGSCTKAMTATLCALLVEEGVLRWEDPVADAFRDLPEVESRWKDATLSMLLHQTAGAPANLDAGGLWARLWSHGGAPQEQRRALAAGVLAAPPVHPPGRSFVYSNAGYALAGAMAERAAKRPWEELTRARIFAPLGMATAGFGAPGTVDAIDAPRGHRADGTPVLPGPGSDNPAAIGPAGTVHASLGDWAKFVALHLRAGAGAKPLLPPAAFRRLHAPPEGIEGGYAMGWDTEERPWAGTDGRPGRVLTHAGSNTHWFCVAWLAPERGFAVLAVANRGGDAGWAAVDEVSGVLVREHLRGSADAKGPRRQGPAEGESPGRR